eukprot:CAMPEP_0182888766 /NCGR_PEP_ID=MMETSP0034_2-20130328/21643_1 /TAXON_ID=156128 /ORGANISM="Nephroselmis pyriformis, Strain CCMP717" /LENGTH=143 /DNA_ID=CAMNT_0025022219 /DNA_START=152 /DNA_END=579 /DNA_ORIENTATION=+
MTLRKRVASFAHAVGLLALLAVASGNGDEYHGRRPLSEARAAHGAGHSARHSAAVAAVQAQAQRIIDGEPKTRVTIHGSRPLVLQPGSQPGDDPYALVDHPVPEPTYRPRGASTRMHVGDHAGARWGTHEFEDHHNHRRFRLP